jgi:cation:H+ antiporter
MQIFLDIVFLAVGFTLLAKGSDFFVDGASSVARRFKIPQLVIGLTIVAMGTSMPEAAVSIQAALQGSADISIGNVVGSNILNILIILGLSAVVFPLAVQKSTQKIEIPIVIGASILLLALGLVGVIEWWGGIIFLVAFIGYLTYLFFSAKKSQKEGVDKEEKAEFNETPLWFTLLLSGIGALVAVSGQFYEACDNIYCLVSGVALFVGFFAYSVYLIIKSKTSVKVTEACVGATEEFKEIPIWKSVVFIVFGMAMIIFGSEFAVSSATSLATRMGVGDAFIGLTIVALGTSLPELFTSVAAAMKKNSDIAIGNVVGSNIFNILFILGITSLITPIAFDSKYLIDTLISLGCAVALLVLTLKGKKLHRWGGAIMLVGYVCYFIYLYMREIA